MEGIKLKSAIDHPMLFPLLCKRLALLPCQNWPSLAPFHFLFCSFFLLRRWDSEPPSFKSSGSFIDTPSQSVTTPGITSHYNRHNKVKTGAKNLPEGGPGLQPPSHFLPPSPTPSPGRGRTGSKKRYGPPTHSLWLEVNHGAIQILIPCDWWDQRKKCQ